MLLISLQLSFGLNVHNFVFFLCDARVLCSMMMRGAGKLYPDDDDEDDDEEVTENDDEEEEDGDLYLGDDGLDSDTLSQGNL